MAYILKVEPSKEAHSARSDIKSFNGDIYVDVSVPITPRKARGPAVSFGVAGFIYEKRFEDIGTPKGTRSDGRTCFIDSLEENLK